jgi:hypothetical protein
MMVAQVSSDIPYVLQDQIPGCVGAGNEHDVVEQGAPGLVVDPFLKARFGERLAWEARTQDVMRRNESVVPNLLR